jgi:MFS family permease
VWVYFVRTLDRLGKGMRTGARDAILADASTNGNRGKIFGFHRSMDTVGAALGPTLALIWLYFRPGDYIPLFFIAFLPGMISVLLLFTLKEQNGLSPQGKTVTFSDSIKWLKSASAAYRTLLFGLLLFAGINSSEIFLLLRAKDLGISDAGVVGLYIFYNLIFALLAYPFGRLSDKVGMKRIFLLGLALFALAYLGMALLSSTIAVILVFFVYGGFAAATDGLAKAWISKVCKPGEKAVGLGTYAGLQSLSLLLGSVWAGLLWDITGPMIVFIVTATLTIPVGLYFMLRIKENVPT